jgi:hypothetical protein
MRLITERTGARKYWLAKAEFTTIRERPIKDGARVIEHVERIHIQPRGLRSSTTWLANLGTLHAVPTGHSPSILVATQTKPARADRARGARSTAPPIKPASGRVNSD